jgi:hypothetical protein
MWDPEARGTNSSYYEPVADPGTAPADAPLVCLQVNASWIPYIVGSLMQLIQPPTWTTTDRTALADLLGRVTDLIALVGTAEVCVAPQFRLAVDGPLQYSLDGGTTWLDVTDWTANLPDIIHDTQARVLMTADLSYPPIPQENADGTDWLYTDHAEG